MRKALVFKNRNVQKRVVQIVNAGMEFSVHADLTWIDCPDNAEEDWEYNGNAVVQSSRPAPPTQDEIVDQLMRQNRLLKALILTLNDGSFVVGGNKTPVQLRAVLKAGM